MKKFKEINKTFVKLKIFTDRARMYLGYVNFFLLNFVFLKSTDVEWLKTDDNFLQLLFYGFILLLGTTLIICIGYLDHILGIRKEEMQNMADINPFAIRVLQDLESIKLDIKSMAEEIQKDKMNNETEY